MHYYYYRGVLIFCSSQDEMHGVTTSTYRSLKYLSEIPEERGTHPQDRRDGHVKMRWRGLRTSSGWRRVKGDPGFTGSLPKDIILWIYLSSHIIWLGLHYIIIKDYLSTQVTLIRGNTLKTQIFCLVINYKLLCFLFKDVTAWSCKILRAKWIQIGFHKISGRTSNHSWNGSRQNNKWKS